jgi:fluoride ion exporter CrcB/FEX
VFAFPIAIAVVNLIGSLLAACVLGLLAVVTAAIGWSLFYELWVPPSPGLP